VGFCICGYVCVVGLELIMMILFISVSKETSVAAPLK